MSGVEILLSDNRGIYIPQDFVRNYDVTLWGFAADDEDIATLREGPDNEWYWDAWNNVLTRAVYIRGNDGEQRWLLSQDGDLFAYCEALMTYDEKVDFFGWAEDEGDGQPTEAEEWASFDKDC
jgi:hypothetical protein